MHILYYYKISDINNDASNWQRWIATSLDSLASYDFRNFLYFLKNFPKKNTECQFKVFNRFDEFSWRGINNKKDDIYL